MATDSFDLSEPELTAADVLVLEDPYFDPDTVAVVTGAASGIGRATTVALAMNDLIVAGADVDEDGLAETAALADDLEAPGEIVSVPTDLTGDGVGAIGNISSIHGHYATQDKPAHITAKHGLHGLTRAIAAEGGGAGFRSASATC